MSKPKHNRPKLLEKLPDQQGAATAVRWIDSPNPAKSVGEKGAPQAPAPAPADSSPKLDPAPTAAAPLPQMLLKHQQLAISLGASLIIGLLVLYVGWSLCQGEVAAKLAALPPAPAPAPAVTPEANTTTADLAKALSEIAALQQQADVMRREQLIMQQSLREALEHIPSTPAAAPQPAAEPAAATAHQPGVPRMADMRLEVSPTQQEFIQLKERNRLTQYGDEAIATGLRQPLETLVEYLRDPAAKHLHDAAQAEYMRAVRSIQLLQRDDPGYRLPVTALFKDKTIRDEADVQPAALLKLLGDYQQPWEVRVRVCFLLLGSPLPETNARLLKAIKEDPSLEVAKHAQLALEQRLKKRFRLFDIPAIEEWTQSQEK